MTLSMIMLVLVRLVDIYSMLIVVYVLMSWLNPNGGIIGTIYDALGTICEPYLSLFRRIIPSMGAGGVRIDFSPIIAIVVLELIVRLLYRFM